jgi:hypothetical protein
MKIILYVVVAFCFFACAVSAHAEGGCPPGQYPQEGQGWKTCVPIPGADTSQQPAQPTVKWYPRAGAIATDGKMGILGTADNERSRAAAEERAMLDCRSRGGAACSLQTSYVNGCGAMTVGASGFGTATGKTKDEAIANSMKQCQSTGDTCHAFYTGCSSASLDP